MPPVSGLERCPGCHPERSEGSSEPAEEILRCAQDDRPYLQMSVLRGLILRGGSFMVQLNYNFSHDGKMKRWKNRKKK